MTFQDAIINVVKDFGRDVLTQSSLFNILNDYHAFDESRSFKMIMKTLISEGYVEQILHVEEWESGSLQLLTRSVETTGLQRNKVEYLLNSMAFAVGSSATRASYGQSSIMNVEYRECPHCKNEHAATALYCENTGKRLKNACTNKACSEYGKYVLPAKAKFCLLCGTPIVDAQEQERMQHSVEIEQLKQRHAMQLQQRQEECNSCKAKFEKREQNFFAEIKKLKAVIEEEKQRQEAQHQKQDTFTANGVTFKMIAVQGATYTMGAADNDHEAYAWEKPAHKKNVSDFMIGETQVTQELWQAVMGSNPSRFIGDLQRPVEMVSWDDCQEFIKKLNQLTGQNFRLPSEAEWEYAARGGNRSKGYKYAGSNDVDAVAWYAYNSNSTTHPVKTKQPNELGIYDMSGNVWEWCQDKWCSNYNSPSNSGFRVLRGCSWNYGTRVVRVSNRSHDGPGFRSDINGLRLAL